MLEICINDYIERFQLTEVSQGKFYLSNLRSYEYLSKKLLEFLTTCGEKKEEEYQNELDEKIKILDSNYKFSKIFTSKDKSKSFLA